MTTQQQRRRQEQRSVVVTDPSSGIPAAGGFDFFTINISGVADTFPAFGTSPALRDRMLRGFWPTEPILASAIYSMVIRNAAFSWTLEGPPRSVAAVQSVLHQSEFGRGWLNMMIKVGVDLFSQDNGAFIEIIREADSPTSPVVGLKHLDSGRCIRTLDNENPVIYEDLKGVRHQLRWYQVQDFTDFPSPVESMRGMQLCAVSRVLRAAQILRDISVFQREKVSGRDPNAIYLASGVTEKQVSDAMSQHKAEFDVKGYTRFILPLIVGSLDPEANISVESINLKDLPDGFNIEDTMRWYINQLALGFGADYQDFAPLPGRGLGTSTQSLVLHQKSRGRGPALFMKTFEHAMNFQGLIPDNVTFMFDEQDIAEDMEQAELERVQAEIHEIYSTIGALDSEAVRQQLFDDGFISEETFLRLQEGGDITEDITAHDEERASEKARHKRNRRRNRRTIKKKDIATKQDDEGPTENLPNFGENIRNQMEDRFTEELGQALEATLDDFQKRIGFKGRWPGFLGFKQNDPFEVLNDSDFWQETRFRVVEVGVSNARDGALAAANFNADLGLAVNLDLVNEGVLEFSRTYANEWWNALETGTREQMRRAIVTWQETGLGTRGFPDLVDALGNTFGRERAKRIATTEVTRIFDEGNNLAHIAAGIVTEEWQTANDAHVEDICRNLDGQRFPTRSGPRPVRDTHIGCRCARLPVGDNGNAIGRNNRG